MSGHPKLNINQIRMAVIPDLLISLVGPVLIYRVAAPHMPTNDALLLAGVLPLLRIAYGFIRHHRLNLIGAFSLLTVALKILLALVLKDTRLILVGDSLITAVFGIALLASLLTASPFLIRLVESVLATTSSEKTPQLIQRWQQPDMRRFFTIITVVWGIGLLLECGIQVLLVFTLTVEQVLLLSPIVRYGVWAILFLWAVLFRWMSRSRKHPTRESIPSGPADEPPYVQSYHS
jgi:intracellular septation protein A